MSTNSNSKKRGRPHEDTCVFCYLRHTTCHGCVSYKLLSSWTPCQLSTYRPVWKKFGSSLFYPDGARLIKKNRFQDAKLFADRLRDATAATFSELGTSPPEDVDAALSKSVSTLKPNGKSGSSKDSKVNQQQSEDRSTVAHRNRRKKVSQSVVPACVSRPRRVCQKVDRKTKTYDKYHNEEELSEEDEEEDDICHDEDDIEEEEEIVEKEKKEKRVKIDNSSRSRSSSTSPSKPRYNIDKDWSEERVNNKSNSRRDFIRNKNTLKEEIEEENEKTEEVKKEEGIAGCSNYKKARLLSFLNTSQTQQKEDHLLALTSLAAAESDDTQKIPREEEKKMEEDRREVGEEDNNNSFSDYRRGSSFTAAMCLGMLNSGFPFSTPTSSSLSSSLSETSTASLSPPPFQLFSSTSGSEEDANNNVNEWIGFDSSRLKTIRRRCASPDLVEAMSPCSSSTSSLFHSPVSSSSLKSSSSVDMDEVTSESVSELSHHHHFSAALTHSDTPSLHISQQSPPPHPFSYALSPEVRAMRYRANQSTPSTTSSSGYSDGILPPMSSFLSSLKEINIL